MCKRAESSYSEIVEQWDRRGAQRDAWRDSKNRELCMWPENQGVYLYKRNSEGRNSEGWWKSEVLLQNGNIFEVNKIKEVNWAALAACGGFRRSLAVFRRLLLKEADFGAFRWISVKETVRLALPRQRESVMWENAVGAWRKWAKQIFKNVFIYLFLRCGAFLRLELVIPKLYNKNVQVLYIIF